MARPFNVQLVQNQREVQQQYRHIENLLMELLSMLRWTPWFTMIDALENAHEPQPPVDDVLAVQNRLNEHFQRGNIEQERPPLPDIVPTNNAPDLIRTLRAQRLGESAAPMNAARASVPIATASAPAPVVAAPTLAPTVADRAPAPAAQVPAPAAAPAPIEVSVSKNLVLQVEITPNSFYSGRRFKLVMIRNNSSNGQYAEARLVLRRKFMLSGIMKTVNSSMLTAVFVIIGLKIFAKQ